MPELERRRLSIPNMKTCATTNLLVSRSPNNMGSRHARPLGPFLIMKSMRATSKALDKYIPKLTNDLG